MDPAALAALLGPALFTAFKKLLEKGVVDPALEKGLGPVQAWLTRGYDRRQDEAELRSAIEAALKTPTGQTEPDPWRQYAWTTALETLQARPDLAARAAAAAVELTRDDPDSLPADLLDELRLTAHRQPFARFLFALRGELARRPGYRDAIAYANHMGQLRRLDGLYELLAALAARGPAGPGAGVALAGDEVTVGGDVVGRDKLTLIFNLNGARELPADARQLERPYLEDVMAVCSQLSFEGRAREEAVAGRGSGLMRLEQVYIALDTAERRRPADRQADREGRQRRSLQAPELERDAPDTRPLSALRAVAEHRHLVLLGEPGAGKSTFTRHLSLCLAGARLDGPDWLQRLSADDLPAWPLPAYLPVFIRLRDFAEDTACLPAGAGQRGEAQHLLAFLRQELQKRFDPPTAAHVQRLLENGEALIVLDGLDEVAHPERARQPENMPQADQARRVQVAEAIADFAQVRFRRARLLVTCRVRQFLDEAGRPLPWPARLGDLPAFTLAEFSRPQVMQFVTQWFAALAGQIAEPDEKRKTLLRALEERPELAELAPKPILLTQMALVHGYRKLPEHRVDVYRECADLLLWEWERLRALGRGRQAQSADDFIRALGVPGLRRDDVEAALYAAVFAEHAEGRKEIREDTVRKHLTAACLAASGWSRDRAIAPAQRFMDEWLRDRNSLLIPAGGDTFDVPHRSFREFMAGRVLAHTGYRAGPQADDERWYEAGPRLALEDPAKWREAFRFAAALEAKRVRDVADALDCLWPAQRGPVGPGRADRLFLAAEVLRDVGPARFRDPGQKRAQEVYERIERALLNLCRDTTGAYPDDRPRLTSPKRLPPATRLQAGWLLSDLGWTPPDLDEFIPLPPGPSPSERGEKIFFAKYPVTNLQYARFLGSDDYKDESLWESLAVYDHEGKILIPLGRQALEWFRANGGPARRPNNWDDARFGAARRLFPVVSVTWYEAAAYCAWLTRRWRDLPELAPLQSLITEHFSLTFRLPLESEWASAAGGAEGDRYPWQEEPQTANEADIRLYANTAESDLNGTSPVFMYPAGRSTRGAMDMAGNVWDWQANRYREGDEWIAQRGGAWSYDRGLARVAVRRYGARPHGWSAVFGLRVVGAAAPVSPSSVS